MSRSFPIHHGKDYNDLKNAEKHNGSGCELTFWVCNAHNRCNQRAIWTCFMAASDQTLETHGHGNIWPLGLNCSKGRKDWAKKAPCLVWTFPLEWSGCVIQPFEQLEQTDWEHSPVLHYQDSSFWAQSTLGAEHAYAPERCISGHFSCGTTRAIWPLQCDCSQSVFYPQLPPTPHAWRKAEGGQQN